METTQQEDQQQDSQIYQPEELMPLVSWRIRKYTSAESTSVPYETARQIMTSILYCMNEVPSAEDHMIMTSEKRPPEEVFREGLEAKKKKIELTKKLFHKIKKEFVDIDNEFYRDTILEGMPAFFKRYDVEYCAQDTILTLDYPLYQMPDLKLCGIDMIYAYLKQFDKEQQLLKKYSKEVLHEVLRLYQPGYQKIVINLYEPILMQKPLCDELEQHRDKLRVVQALREDAAPEGFRDGEMMQNDKLRALIEELRECRYLSDKLSMVRREVHSIRDLKEILNTCFWGDERNAVLELLTPDERKYLIKEERKDWQDADFDGNMEDKEWE